MRILITAFKGAFPRISPDKLDANAASFAQNLDALSGSLVPTALPLDSVQLPEFGGEIKGAYLWRIGEDEYWLQFRDYVDVIRSPIADDAYKRIYWSGDSRDADGDVLFSYTPNIHTGGTVYPTTWYKLGIPAPQNAPIIDSAESSWQAAASWTAATAITEGTYILPTSPDGINVYLCTESGTTGATQPTWPTTPNVAITDGTVKWVCIPYDTFNSVSEDARVYFYTYVGALGEESAPSPASDLTIVPNDDATVELSGLAVDAGAATGRQITAIRIYRSIVSTAGQAVALFVAEIPTSQDTYTDTRKSIELAEEIPSLIWDAPRSGMKGLGLTAYGVAYGFFEKNICMSVPFVPYAWPRDYELTTQYDVVAIGHYDSYMIVGTLGNPVIVGGYDPESMSMTELPIMEACVSAKSMVSMGYGAIYASPNGLVMAYGNSAQLVTKSLFSEKEWQALNPSSIHATEHRGKYLFFYSTTVLVDGEPTTQKGAYLFDPKMTEMGIVHFDVWCKSVHRDLETDTLYLLQDDGQLVIFDDKDAERATMQWKSRKFIFSNRCQFLAAVVDAESYDQLTFTLYVDGEVAHSDFVTSRRPFRLPKLGLSQEFEIAVSGKSIVRRVGVGETIRELNYD